MTTDPIRRIGAIRNSENGIVYMFGFGTYEGEEVPPNDEKGERGLIGLLYKANRKNPKLKMDNGTIVWGCECWWGDEDKIKEKIRDRKIVMVKPEYEL